MTGLQWATYIRKQTRTDSSTLPDAEIVSIGNVIKDEYASEIEAINENFFGSIETTPLLKTSVTREYPLPTDILNRLTFLEVKFDGTNWIKVEGIDVLGKKRPVDETSILEDYDNSQGGAAFDIYRGSMWLYSGTVDAEIAAGIRLWVFTYPADLTETILSKADDDLSLDPSNTTHGIPRAIQGLLADEVVINYKTNRDKPIALSDWEKQLGNRKTATLDRMRGVDMSFAVVLGIPEEAEDNDGFDL